MDEQSQAIKDEERILDTIARALILIAKNIVPNDNENEHSGDNNKS